MKRGEIWWARLREPIASEPGYDRPVVIVSANSFNNSRIQTVLVATITSQLKFARAPGNILLSKKISKLSKESVINISQILTLDRRFLVEKVSQLDSNHLSILDVSLKMSLGLDGTI